jgi:hypothetical protein
MAPTPRRPAARPLPALPAALPAALLALCGAAHADVIPVPGVYNTLQVAVNNAHHGDVILIQSGFVSAGPVEIVDKALTLVVDNDGQATVPRIVIRDLAADHHVVLRGLGADGNIFPLGPAEEGLVVTDCQGRVTVEGSTFRGTHGWQPGFAHPQGYAAVRIEDSASVALSHCLLVGGRGKNTGGELSPPGFGAPGLHVRDADVTVAFCESAGGDGGHADGDEDYEDGMRGGAGIQQDGGTLHVSGALLAGGDGGNGSCDFDPLIGLICGAGGDGGDGLFLQGGATAYHHGLTFTPGLGGVDAGREDSQDGVLVDADSGAPSHVPLPSASRDFTAPAVKRPGQSATLQFSGEPGDVALAWIAPGPRWVLLPAYEGVFLVDNGAPFNLFVPLAPTGPAGDFAVSFGVPPLPAGLEAVPLHVQGIFQAGSGQFLLGPSSVLTLLDTTH